MDYFEVFYRSKGLDCKILKLVGGPKETTLNLGPKCYLSNLAISQYDHIALVCKFSPLFCLTCIWWINSNKFVGNKPQGWFVIYLCDHMQRWTNYC